LSSGPKWADDPDSGDASEGGSNLQATPKRVDLTIGGDPSSEDFFSYEQSKSLPEVTDSIIAEGKKTRRGARGGGDLLTRIATGVVLGGVAILCLAISKLLTLLLIAVVLLAASAEFFGSLRKVGYQPATLLGMVSVVALPLSVYWRGEGAIGLVLFLSLVAGILWYLLGIGGARPVPNLAVVILGIVYIGVLGSFGVLLLDHSEGRGLLLAAILLAAGYDIGGYFIGRALGRSPLTEVSPNKTIEGLIGGAISTVGVSVLISLFNVGPFDGNPFGFSDALIVGIVVAFIAPIGDLAESLIKRDLRIKDMGSILPGHGGVLDRCDALLFVLPSVYFMVRVLA
jgi:phosphatidate cytidylyltransferase